MSIVRFKEEKEERNRCVQGGKCFLMKECRAVRAEGMRGYDSHQSATPSVSQASSNQSARPTGGRPLGNRVFSQVQRTIPSDLVITKRKWTFLLERSGSHPLD